jgi:CoA:oxalate CoA-transferase
LVIAAGNDALFRRLCQVIDRSELSEDERFRTNPARTDHRIDLQHEVEDALGHRPVSHWLSRLAAADIPCGPINDVRAVLADPQVRARNMVVPVDDDRLAGFSVAGNPIKLSAFPDAATRGAVPDLEA